MATSKTPKRTTAADIAAAVKLGTIDPTAEVMTPAEAQRIAAAAEHADVVNTAQARPLSATEHECGIPGCRHGAAHSAAPQPDRQVKLQCPGCGAVARMTSGALAKTLGVGIVCGGDGNTFVPAERRTYSRKGN